MTELQAVPVIPSFLEGIASYDNPSISPFLILMRSA